RPCCRSRRQRSHLRLTGRPRREFDAGRRARNAKNAPWWAYPTCPPFEQPARRPPQTRTCSPGGILHEQRQLNGSRASQRWEQSSARRVCAVTPEVAVVGRITGEAAAIVDDR